MWEIHFIWFEYRVLKKNDVTDEQIIKINFEEAENEFLLNRKKLHSYVKERLIPDKMNCCGKNNTWKRTKKSRYNQGP